MGGQGGGKEEGRDRGEVGRNRSRRQGERRDGGGVGKDRGHSGRNLRLTLNKLSRESECLRGYNWAATGIIMR